MQGVEYVEGPFPALPLFPVVLHDGYESQNSGPFQLKFQEQTRYRPYDHCHYQSPSLLSEEEKDKDQGHSYVSVINV